eukprot:6466412-Alexandrium_andersonii.AAC.1
MCIRDRVCIRPDRAPRWPAPPDSLSTSRLRREVLSESGGAGQRGARCCARGRASHCALSSG